jgi:4-hydroxybenzoate polyprenyltransferase
MSNWIKWWKDSTFMSVLGVALLTMLIGFLLAYYIEWGWILTIVVTAIGGMSIRRIIIKRIDKMVNKKNNKRK